MKKRASGILLHISSLPSRFGIGDLGPDAYKFVDFLAQAKQTYWQILPLNPTDIAMGNCPYSSCSAFANNILFISPELLVEHGFLKAEDIKETPLGLDDGRVNYKEVISYKNAILEKAFAHCHAHLEKNSDFKKFCEEHKAWLDDYSLFIALKDHFQGLPWHQWPDNIRARKPEAIEHARHDLKRAILEQKFFQYLFMRQWTLLKKYCKAKGILIVGDLPIYVQHDSADVWTNPSIFKLDKDGHVEFMAGVPPDYFSKTGQLWGNPVYDWDVLKKTNYAWWQARLKHNFSLFDIVRIDHFRAFVDFWQVPHGEETAINGSWEQGPGDNFFNKMLKAFKSFPIIAEDLGFLSDGVVEAIKKYKFPGMKILLFAFDSDDQNPYLPQNHIKNCLVYTGTHDNNTAKGWFKHEATEPIKQKMLEVLGEEPTLETVASDLVHLAMESVANTTILPMQDILGLDETARMNIPGVVNGNWEWRLLAAKATPVLAGQLAKLTKETKRI